MQHDLECNSDSIAAPRHAGWRPRLEHVGAAADSAAKPLGRPDRGSWPDILTHVGLALVVHALWLLLCARRSAVNLWAGVPLSASTYFGLLPVSCRSGNAVTIQPLRTVGGGDRRCDRADFALVQHLGCVERPARRWALRLTGPAAAPWLRGKRRGGRLKGGISLPGSYHRQKVSRRHRSMLE